MTIDITRIARPVPATIIPALTYTPVPRPHATGSFTLGTHEYVFDVVAYPNTDDRQTRYTKVKDKGRIHVSTSRAVDEVWGIDDAHRPPYGKRGDEPADDARWDAFNKLEIETQRQLIDLALPVLYPGITKADIAMKTFSRKAGCSCGCSPGWRMGEDLTKATALPWKYMTSNEDIRFAVVLSFEFCLEGESIDLETRHTHVA